MERYEDIYDTPEFKSLSRWRKFKVRVIVSFFASLEMF